MLKNVGSQSIGAQMVDASDGSAFTGATVAVYITGDAGTQALGSVGSGICTHEGNGYHSYGPSQGETNYDLIAFTFIGIGAIPATVQVFTTEEIADTILDRDMSSGTDSGSASVRTVRQALRFLRNKWTLTGTALSVKKEDDSTESWAATVGTTTSTDGITSVDPAD